ncbi:hypothetical protein PR202_ga13056 [Eleusine coracana subsp. coracana]|uniref:Uncharacterized protein n=1 Tax=Eleusine coracana subsp. coracana TaxID=191504 RepID=A0AAV5CDT0_ELECO|nr:hypothetical protein PR202_ga13056 [Eleusine coracana subsp. coracana]
MAARCRVRGARASGGQSERRPCGQGERRRLCAGRRAGERRLLGAGREACGRAAVVRRAADRASGSGSVQDGGWAEDKRHACSGSMAISSTILNGPS